jgi:hypothetical protein
MIRRFIISLFLCLVSTFVSKAANAGVFGSDEPPQEFMDSSVSSMHGLDIDFGYTVRQLLTTWKNDKVNWEKDGDNWILHVDRVDKMAGTNVKFAILFHQFKNKRALVLKWNVDGEYVDPGVVNNMLMQIQRGFLESGAIKAPQQAPAESKNQVTPPTTQKRKVKANTIDPKPTVESAKPAVDAQAQAKNAEQKRLDDEKSQIAKMLAALVGHWDGRERGGAVDIVPDGDSSARMSYTVKECSFKDKALDLSSKTLSDGDCKLSLKLTTVKSTNQTILKIEENQKCKALCPEARGYYFNGSFLKK